MTPPKRLPQQPTPKVVDTYANVWGLPDRYRGASLVSLDARKSAWLTDAVRAWILSAVNGSAFRPGNLVSAAGLTAVGEEQRKSLAAAGSFRNSQTLSSSGQMAPVLFARGGR